MKFPLIVASPLIFLAVRADSSSGTGPVYTIKSSSKGACINDMNAAREAVGLSAFKEATEGGQIPNGETNAFTDKTVWDPICQYIVDGTIATPADAGAAAEANLAKNGTYAFMPQTSETPDCTAAVQHWKSAYSNFPGIPPNNVNGKDLYKKPENISFIALYNPGANATASCAVVTCEKEVVKTPAARQKETISKRSLVCLTTPNAFTGSKEPFTKEQWEKISAVLGSSASVAAPSLLAVAAAALGLSLL